MSDGTHTRGLQVFLMLQQRTEQKSMSLVQRSHNRSIALNTSHRLLRISQPRHGSDGTELHLCLDVGGQFAVFPAPRREQARPTADDRIDYSIGTRLLLLLEHQRHRASLAIAYSTAASRAAVASAIMYERMLVTAC